MAYPLPLGAGCGPAGGPPAPQAFWACCGSCWREEAGIAAQSLPRLALFGLQASLALALDLAGLALDGVEHAPHVT
jgi:hypothetical protein